MATITLFQDVAAVQCCLESLNILDFDANRIYELLEEHEKNPQRVNLVVNNIRGLMSTGFAAGDYDVLSPDVVDFGASPPKIPKSERVFEQFGSLISEKVLEIEAGGCSKDNKAGMPCTASKALQGINRLAVYHNDMNNNDNDPNNNAAPDLETVREKRPNTPIELTIFSEALKIHEVVPGHSVQAIKEALFKHVSSRNRVQIVTHQLLYEWMAGISEEGRECEGIHCPIPSKKPKSEEHAPGEPAERDKELLSTPRSDKTPFQDFYVDLDYREYVPKPTNGPANCTIVRPAQEETATATAAERRPELRVPVLATPATVVEARASVGEMVQNMDWADADNEAVPKVNKIAATFADALTVAYRNPFTVPRQVVVPVPSGVNADVSALRPVQTRKVETEVTAVAEPFAIQPEPATGAIRKVENWLYAKEAAVPNVVNKIPATFADSQKIAYQNPFAVPRQAEVWVPTGVNADVAAIRPVEMEKVESEVSAASGVLTIDDGPGPSTGAIRKNTNRPVGGEVAVPKVIAPPHKFLRQVRELFPHVQVSFLERQCVELLENEPLEFLVEKILLQTDLPLKQNFEINPDMTEILPKGCKEDEDAAFQAFVEILPNADPEYLETMYKELAQDGDQLKDFVANALEKRDYPTLEAYKRRQAHFALEKRFKDNFNLAEFLEQFPDPFNHFKDPSKLPAPKTACLASRAYLMARYRTVRAVEIDRAYKRHGFMLYPTCKELDSAPATRRPRNNHEINADHKPENTLSFWQQIAFIENESKIAERFKQIQDAKEKAARDKKKAFDKAKKMGELLTCGCCYDEEVLDIDMVTCEEGHLFCKECVKKGAEVQIGQGKTDFPCLEDCGANIRLATLETVLLPSVFARLVQRKQIEEVKAAGIESFETCPFCDFGLIPHPDDRIFSCLNPECLKQSCRLCKELSHIPFRCDEVEKSDEVKARTYIEDKMTEALIRTCWKCQKKFVKSDGCNHMTCSCGAQMCYVCRQPMGRGSHFNHNKCFQNINQLHVDAIAEVARQAKEEMAAKNPALSLKHDPTLILPEKVPGRKQQLLPAPYLYQQMNQVFVNLVDGARRAVEAVRTQAAPAQAQRAGAQVQGRTAQAVAPRAGQAAAARPAPRAPATRPRTAPATRAAPAAAPRRS